MPNISKYMAALCGGLALVGCAHTAAEGQAVSNPQTEQRIVAGAALADAKECTVCHDVRTDKVGPAFQRVARRFNGVPDGREKLLEVVQAGTKSSSVWHWGSVKMPTDAARVPVNPDEAELLVDYVLSLE